MITDNEDTTAERIRDRCSRESVPHARVTGGVAEGAAPTLIPVIKLAEKMTYAPWRHIPCPAVVVKAQDLLSRDGRSESAFFDTIARAGGLHEFLSYDGAVILSSVMPDEMILGHTPKGYVRLITEMKPDYYLTPDGETYLGEPHLSELEISRIMKETQYILDAGLDPEPIGLVKGCSAAQASGHADALLDLGVQKLAFHAGAFLFRGNEYSISKAKMIYRHIRKKAPWLMAYGVGSKMYFRMFGSADSFVTHSHFADAFHGLKSEDGRKSRLDEDFRSESIMANLKDLYACVQRLGRKGEIDRWVHDQNQPQPN